MVANTANFNSPPPLAPCFDAFCTFAVKFDFARAFPPQETLPRSSPRQLEYQAVYKMLAKRRRLFIKRGEIWPETCIASNIATTAPFIGYLRNAFENAGNP